MQMKECMISMKMDLKSKDKTIQDLQAEKENLEAQIKVVRDLREAAESKAREAKEKMENSSPTEGSSRAGCNG